MVLNKTKGFYIKCNTLIYGIFFIYLNINNECINCIISLNTMQINNVFLLLLIII